LNPASRASLRLYRKIRRLGKLGLPRGRQRKVTRKKTVTILRETIPKVMIPRAVMPRAINPRAVMPRATILRAINPTVKATQREEKMTKNLTTKSLMINKERNLLLVGNLQVETSLLEVTSRRKALLAITLRRRMRKRQMGRHLPLVTFLLAISLKQAKETPPNPYHPRMTRRANRNSVFPSTILAHLSA